MSKIVVLIFIIGLLIPSISVSGEFIGTFIPPTQIIAGNNYSFQYDLQNTDTNMGIDIDSVELHFEWWADCDAPFNETYICDDPPSAYIHASDHLVFTWENVPIPRNASFEKLTWKAYIDVWVSNYGGLFGTSYFPSMTTITLVATDFDNDTVYDHLDDFPTDSTESKDTDGDGVGDNSDFLPDDSSQWIDTDGDGYGDNTNGTNPDMFPNDLNEWDDTDNDGVGDNSDVFPSNSTEWDDFDQDGFGDNFDTDDDNDGVDDLNDPEPYNSKINGNEINITYLVAIIIILSILMLISVMFIRKRK